MITLPPKPSWYWHLLQEKEWADTGATIVLVVDSADRDMIDEVRTGLHRIARETSFTRSPLLVLANKQDVAAAMTVEEVSAALGLEKLSGWKWHIQVGSFYHRRLVW